MGPPKTMVLTKRDKLHLEQLSSAFSLGTGCLHHTFSTLSYLIYYAYGKER